MSMLKPNLIAMSAIVASSAFASQIVVANENPFEMTDLSSGYMVAGNHGKHKKMKKMDTDGSGSISKDEFMAYSEKKFDRKDKNGDGEITPDEMRKHKEGKCGEGKCGEGKCGESKSGEGKCGEGKCGES